MRLDRFFLPRIIIKTAGLIGERIDAAATDKQYMEYKRARRLNERAEYCNNGNVRYKTENSIVKSTDNIIRDGSIIKNRDNIIRKRDTQGYVISSCEADDYDYRDYDYYNKRRRGGFTGLRGRSYGYSDKQHSEHKRGRYAMYDTGKYKRDQSSYEKDIGNEYNQNKRTDSKYRKIRSDIGYAYGTDDYSLMADNKETARNIVRRCMAVMIFIAIYLLVPAIITMKLTGVVDMVITEEAADGKTITVNYKNASQTVEVDKFVSMVLADRLYMGDEVELLKAESIMIRTDIYRMMGEKMNMDSGQLGMTYLTTNQMKKKWGREYSDNYNLVTDCVAATRGMVISYNGQYIDARYTYITAGSTLSGCDMLGDNYSYLAVVECPKDKEAEEYLVVKTISCKDFVNAFERAYNGLALDKKGLDKQVQIVSANRDGYVSKMQVGNMVMTGSAFARILGLNSPDYKLEYMDSGVKVTTTGVGDGYGVSVYTAQNMAKEGASYEDILKTFYSGIIIGNCSG